MSNFNTESPGKKQCTSANYVISTLIVVADDIITSDVKATLCDIK